jgi:hypothetical protein
MLRYAAHHTCWVGEIHQHKAADRSVEQSVDRELAQISLDETHLRGANCRGAGPCEFERSSVYVQTDHFAGRSDEFGGEQGHIASPAAHVKNTQSRSDAGF